MNGPARAHELAAGAPGGQLVVFAHGLEDSWRSWQAVAREFGPAARLMALDLPWRAGNDYMWRVRRPDQWLGDALDGIGARPDLLVAHSFGANATLDLLCAGDPRPGRAVALVCPFYRRPAQPVGWEMFERSRASFTSNIREGVVARLGRRAAALDPDVLRTMTDLAVQRTGPSAFLAVFDRFAASGLLALDQIARPTLVISGGADPVLSGRAADELSGAIPGARWHADPELDHYCHIRRPARVAAQLAGFAAEQALLTRTSGEPR